MPWKVALTWILPLLAALNWLIRLLKATPLAAPRPCQTVISVTPLAFFRADASGTDDPLPSPLEVELQAAEPAMMIVNRARMSPAPSIRAASQIAVGTAANACRSRKTGYPAARYGITTPRIVLRSPIELTSS